jgi:hypothetical protein
MRRSLVTRNYINVDAANGFGVPIESWPTAQLSDAKQYDGLPDVTRIVIDGEEIAGADLLVIETIARKKAKGILVGGIGAGDAECWRRSSSFGGPA